MLLTILNEYPVLCFICKTGYFLAHFLKTGYDIKTMSVRMRHTRAHTKNRRAHHALEMPRLSACQKCGTAQLPHHMCGNCGNYRGRQIIDMAGKTAMRAKRRQEKLKSLGEVKKKDEAGKEKSLSAEALSAKKKK